MILVTGATGNTGSLVIKQLSENGIHARAMVHNPDKASVIANYDVEIVRGDYDNIDSLNSAMQGVDHVYLVSPSGPKQVQWEKHMLDAAIRAGTGHLVKLSVMGASPFSPIAIERFHWESEKNIENSEIPFTFVRPNFFMQDMLSFGPTIAAEGKFYASMGDGRMSVIDARDIASVAVMALTEKGHIGKTYEITGPEALTYSEMAAKISLAIGATVEYVDLPQNVARQNMIDAGMPEWLAEDFINYQRYFMEGCGWNTTNWVTRVTGKTPIDFDRFARDHAWAFRGVEFLAA